MDQVEHRHRLALQGVNDVAIIDNMVSEARASIGRYSAFYNSRRSSSSLDRQTADQAYLTGQPRSAAAWIRQGSICRHTRSCSDERSQLSISVFPLSLQSFSGLKVRRPPNRARVVPVGSSHTGNHFFKHTPNSESLSILTK